MEASSRSSRSTQRARRPDADAAAADGAASGLTLGGFALVIAEIDALFELEEDDDES